MAYRALLACAVLTISAYAAEVRPDPAAHVWMQTALERWGSVCQRHLRLPVEPLPWVIFYDDTYAWHLNAEHEMLPFHETATVTLNFAGKAHTLRRLTHNQGLWVPGRDNVLPLKIAASAMLYDNDTKPFCIIPLPAKFHQLAPVQEAMLLDELFLGLAVHELTHTRQLPMLMGQIQALGKSHKLPEHLNDNLLQDTLGENKEYAQHFDREMDALGDAVMADTKTQCKRELGRALTRIQQRRARYFTGERKMFAPLEEIFLTLEGAAMWAQFQMTRDQAPAGESRQTTLMKLVQRTNAWSQTEGLALFLLIDRLVPNWQPRFFAPNPPSPFALLRTVSRSGVKKRISTARRAASHR